MGTTLTKNTQFGIEEIKNNSIADISTRLSDLVNRGIIVGGTDFNKVIEAYDNDQKIAVMTGIKPSGSYHFGSLLTVNELVAFQQLGAIAYFCIADIEAYLDTGLSFEKSEQLAVSNLADVLALGFDPDRAVIYRQSTEPLVQFYGLRYSNFITYNTLKAIYGVKEKIAYYNAALIQVADILLPQLNEKPMITITPVGMDQANHARLTRDIVRKAHPEFNLPSFMFHSIIKGLDGSEKMSKSNPLSYFVFDDPIDKIFKIINRAKTGGRDTATEQRVSGANPDICRIYDLYKFGIEPDSSKLNVRRQECITGSILCGRCKSELKDMIRIMKNDHLEKKSFYLELSQQLIKSSSKSIQSI